LSVDYARGLVGALVGLETIAASDECHRRRN